MASKKRVTGASKHAGARDVPARSAPNVRSVPPSRGSHTDTKAKAAGQSSYRPGDGLQTRPAPEISANAAADLFQKAFRSSSIALVISRLEDGRLLEVNEAFARLSGYARKDLIGRTSVETGLITLQERSLFAQTLGKKGEVRETEMQLRGKGGKEIWVLASAERIELQGEECVIWTGSEITRRKRAEEALRNVALFPEENPSPVLRAGGDGTLLFANRASTLLLNLWQCKVGERAPEMVRRAVERALEASTAQELELEAGPRKLSFVLMPFRERGYVNLYGRDITAHRQAEEALRESESRARVAEALKAERQRFYGLLNTLPAYLILLTQDYRVSFANRFFEERFGKADGKRCFEYLFGRPEPCEKCETFIPLKTSAQHEWEWTGPDGRIYEIHDFPFPDVDGSTLIMETGIDITARKKAEAALKEANERLEERVLERTEELRRSEARLRLAMEGAQLGMWSFDFATGRRECTPSTFELWGFAPGAAMPSEEEWLARVHPEDRQRHLDAYKSGIAAGVPCQIQYRVVWPDGSVHWLETRARSEVDAPGKPLRLVGVTFDVTERRAAEEGLRQSEELFRVIFTQSSVGKGQTDPTTGRFLRVNAAFCRIAGYSEEQLLQRTFSDITHPDDREADFERFQRLVRGEVPSYQCEKRYVRGDGTVTWVNVTVNLIRDAAGRPLRSIAVVQDISVRKEAEAVLMRSKADLERLVAERTAKLKELVGELEHFSYTITHDMRAPLRAMRGFGELVSDLCADCPHQEQKEFIRRIIVSAERMDALIRDALNYSRAIRLELPLEDVDLGSLLRGMLDSYPEFQLSRARISIDGELPLVLGNEAALTQCFSNLLGNAVKFAKPGQIPEIRIWAEAAPPATGNPKTEKGTDFRPIEDGLQTCPTFEEGRVRIWVEDHGIGIPKGMLPKVFDMFSRGSATHEGTGIGLALVRKVTHRMGGKVGVESEEGKGSRFWVELRTAEFSDQGG